MKRVWTFVKGAWKAVTAAATTAMAPYLDELFQSLSDIGKAVVLAGIGALITYLVPNIKSS